MIYLPAVDEIAPAFPSTDQALEDPDGLLAIGGRLNTRTLLLAYRHGIFPWFEDQQPILWWCPSTRAVLIPGAEHVSRSMGKVIKSDSYQITTDRCFDEVVRNCAAPRAEHQGTWITSEMARAYGELHKLGSAHSVECWREGRLVGGLYGVHVGGIFCGESMFSKESNTSKLAFIALSRALAAANFDLIDCQLENPHLISLGVNMISKTEFLEKLESSNKLEINWPDSEKFQQCMAGLND